MASPRPIFDAYLMVDWSAAAVPRRGRDSIWFALTARGLFGLDLVALRNPSTRDEATAGIGALMRGLAAEGWRTLVGFDFPIGYPAGSARKLGLTGNAPWRGIWRLLFDELRDGPDNANNRFDVAEALNRRMGGEPFPFWGHAGPSDRPLLPRRGRRPHGEDDLAERRATELRIRRAQPVWKLAGAGAVGGQALTGIPRLEQLRRDPDIAPWLRVWPFETGLRRLERPDEDDWRLLLAEVYPSLVEPEEIGGRPKDAGQVAAIGRHFAGLDESGALADLFLGDPSLEGPEREAVEREEAWILGVGAAAAEGRS